jgi:hypothetical protein
MAGSTMKSRVDPSALAEIFAGAVALAARELADRIEYVLHPHQAWPAESRSTIIDAATTSMKFMLDATGRIASEHLTPAERKLFLSKVRNLTLERGHDETRTTDIASSRQGSRPKGVGRNEGGASGSALLWEFAKSVGRRDYRGTEEETIVSLVASNMFTAQADGCAHCAEHQMVPSEISGTRSESADLDPVSQTREATIEALPAGAGDAHEPAALVKP